MVSNLNRRRLFFLTKKNIFNTLTLFLFLLLISFFYFYSHNIIKNFNNMIEKFSENYDYRYKKLNVTGISYVDRSFLENKLKKYFNTSIFLLPLNDISIDIKKNNWIKNITLSTNFKNTLFIDIEEFNPVGIYSYNNKLFYFDKNGKIIEEINKKLDYQNNLIIFSGSSSNLEAYSIIDILNSLSFHNKYKILRIDYVEKRRWDIILKNNIKLMLSENNPKNSLENFMNIEKNLSETEINNIKYVDLRNTSKTIINYNE